MQRGASQARQSALSDLPKRIADFAYVEITRVRETENARQADTTLELIRLYTVLCLLAVRLYTPIKRPETQHARSDAGVHPPPRGDTHVQATASASLETGDGTRGKRVLRLIRPYPAHSTLSQLHS